MATGGRAVGWAGLRVMELPGLPSSGEREVGMVGTVVNYNNERYTAVVRWDNDEEAEYSYKGPHEQYGLLIVDSGPIGTKHGDPADPIKCQACGLVIGGARWKCSHPDCASGYDLCSPCYHSMKDTAQLRHATPHNFNRYDFPHSAGVPVGNRWAGEKVMIRGVFEKAIVRRGKDWCWDEQDGGVGGTGRVTKVDRDWLPNARFVRGSLEVLWTRTQRHERYRFGFSGKTEVIGVNLTNGGYVYPTHLPKLGTNDYLAPRLFHLGISMPNFYDMPTVATVAEGTANLHIAEPSGTATASATTAATAAIVSETLQVSQQQPQVSQQQPQASQQQPQASQQQPQASQQQPQASQQQPQASQQQPQASQQQPQASQQQPQASQQQPQASGFTPSGRTVRKFRVGEFVQLKRIPDAELVRLTTTVSEWNDLIYRCKGEIGYVHKMATDSGGVRVQFRRRLGRWTLHTSSLDRIQEPFNHKYHLRVGDQVRALSNLQQLIDAHTGGNRALWNNLDWVAGRSFVVMIIHNDDRGEIDELTVQYSHKDIVTLKFECFETTVTPVPQSHSPLPESFPMAANFSDFQRCIEEGIVGPVREALQRRDVKVNQPLGEGKTALMIAASLGDETMVDVLMNFSPSVDFRVCSTDDTALLLAVKGNAAGVVQRLLSAGADFQAEGVDHSTPLHLAVDRGMVEVAHCLLNWNRPSVAAVINKRGPGGRTPLHVAIEHHNHDILPLLLLCPDLDLTLQTPGLDSYNCFHLAILKNDPEAMTMILRRQPSMLNQLRPEDGAAGIHVAIMHKSLLCLHELCRNPLCDINLGSQTLLETPLHLAVRYRCVEAVDLLVQQQCNLLARDIRGDTVLHYAALALCSQGIPAPSSYQNLLEINDLSVTASVLATTCSNDVLAILAFLLLRTDIRAPYQDNSSGEKPLTCLEELVGYNSDFICLLLFFHNRLRRVTPQRVNPPPAQAAAAVAVPNDPINRQGSPSGSSCQICKDREVNAVMIPCGHTGCASCLATYFETSGRAPVLQAANGCIGICYICRGGVSRVNSLFL